MSMEFLNLAFNANIKGASKAVFIALADRANRGGYCFMSLADIAFRAGCDRRTVMRSIATLETLGHVAVIRDKGLTNHYMILPPNTDATSDNASPVSECEVDQSLYTASDTKSPEKVIHTGDTMSKTSDTVSKTSDMSSPKPNITQLTQKPRARGSAQNPPEIPDLRKHQKSQTGQAGLRGIREIFTGIAPSIVSKPSTQTPQGVNHGR